VEVESAAGNSGSLDDRVDIRRVRAGTLELHDGGIEHPRARFAALGFPTRCSFWHSPIVQHLVDSLTDIT
jgi:hypothetical protein